MSFERLVEVNLFALEHIWIAEPDVNFFTQSQNNFDELRLIATEASPRNLAAMVECMQEKLS